MYKLRDGIQNCVEFALLSSLISRVQSLTVVEKGIEKVMKNSIKLYEINRTEWLKIFKQLQGNSHCKLSGSNTAL